MYLGMIHFTQTEAILKGFSITQTKLWGNSGAVFTVCAGEKLIKMKPKN